MLDLIVLHGEFSLFTVRGATFGTKFIKIRDKKFCANSWRLLHRLQCNIIWNKYFKSITR